MSEGRTLEEDRHDEAEKERGRNGNEQMKVKNGGGGPFFVSHGQLLSAVPWEHSGHYVQNNL